MESTIGDLFKVSYGQKDFENKEILNNGKTLLISSSGTDNGCIGFFDIKPFYKKPFITIPRTGSVGEAFVQIYECCVNNNVIVLTPKKDLEIEILFQVAHQIRLNKWRYTFYGRTVTPSKIEKQVINIDNLDLNYKEIMNKLLPKEKNKIKILKYQNSKMIKVKDLCNIHKKTGIPKNAINLGGQVPYVSSSSQNNGVVLLVDEEPNFKAGSLTIAKDGNDGIAFYQPFDFLTSLHNYVLTLKNNFPKWILLYIGSIIQIKCYGYNHYYPLSKKHLERMEIEIPMKNGKIDLEYIEKIVKNSYGYEEIEQYL